ncbi:acyltransferase family protein [Streptomyces acidiscabies]|uniref:acyltransferase family protein n=1 Tax=Streptomyces acidiscabies TaxID=42234 RepID=UPI00067E3AEE|nr:acyltransferase [Streptomyces acidiscabies]
METPQLSARPSRLPSLTGTRAFAALAVLITHIAGLYPGQPHVFMTIGPVALTFFFMLSGFILAWVDDPKDTALKFWRRRLVKVFPNHWVTFAITLALMATAGVSIKVINTVPVFFLVEPWVPNFDTLGGLNGINVPTWSLCCELIFYLCFPLLIRYIRRIRAERLWPWVGAVAAGTVLVPFVALLLPRHPATSWEPTIPEWHSWFVYSFPFTRMLEFVLGLLLARVVMSGRWIRLGMAPAFLLLAVCTGIQAYLPGIFRISAGMTALPVALTIAACAAADIRGVRTPFNGRVMVWLGEISFAFYMVHWLVIQYGPLDAINGVDTGSATDTAFNILLTVILSFALAVALYTMVERPAVQRFSVKRPRPAEQPAEVREPSAVR